MHGRLFNFALLFITAAMFGMLFLVVIVAYGRKSGHTGQDIAQIHLIQHAEKK